MLDSGLTVFRKQTRLGGAHDVLYVVGCIMTRSHIMLYLLERKIQRPRMCFILYPKTVLNTIDNVLIMC